MSITVGYWTIRGLGAPLRMMVLYAGMELVADNVDLKEKPEGGFDASAWFASKKPALKERNALINLPYVVDGDMVVSQTNACLAYLGRRLDLWGHTLQETTKCEELLCEVMDLRNKMIEFAYDRHKDMPGGAVALIADVAGILSKLELCLSRNAELGKGCFFVTSHATGPDFHIWEMLDQYLGMAEYYNLPEFLSPSLKEFHAKFQLLDGNAKYFASALVKLPYNQKMADFGATPSRDLWQQGQTYDWAAVSGPF